MLLGLLLSACSGVAETNAALPGGTTGPGTGDPGGGTSGGTLSVRPASTTVNGGATVAFATTPGGTQITINWSVAEAGCGSVTSAGVYTAPTSSATCHVVAQVAGTSVSATAAVQVQGLTTGGTAPKVAVGINIEGVSDWSPQHMFADLMKSARYWYTTWPTAAAVDAAGWPKGDANLVVATGPGLYGRSDAYKLSFTGKANVSGQGLTVSNVVYTAATNTTTADVVIQANSNSVLMFSSTRRLPTDGTATGITNVKLMMPGHAPTEIYGHDFVARLAGFSHMRFMQASGQTGTGSPANPDVNWSDRAKPNWPQQTGLSGIAWEYVILLANQVQKDVWINVPLNASNDYVTKLAQLFKYGSDGVNPYTSAQANPVYPPLAPNLKVYVEYVNELWNGFYTSTGANITMAQNEYSGGNPYGYTSSTGLAVGLQRQARRTKEISDAFKSVFGAGDMMTRVRPVFCSQFGNWGTYDYGLQWAQSKYGPLGDWLYALAGAPYVTVNNENADGMTTQQVLSEMYNNVHKSGGFLDQTDQFKALAARYDARLKIVAYEGGAGNFAGHSDAAKLAAQTDPQMGTIVSDLVHHWYSVSGEGFMYYTLCASNQFGYFALTNDITVSTGPKWDALRAIEAGQ